MDANGRERTVRADSAGRDVLSFTEAERNGQRWAVDVEVLRPGAADLVSAEMQGWSITGPVELGEELVRRGAHRVRLAHAMTRSLGLDPPPPQWSESAPGAGLRIVPCDREAFEVFPAWRAAFPPGHPDWHNVDDERMLTEELIPLFAGQVLGPVLACSALAVTSEDQVVAGIVVNDRDGSPWVGGVFRDPDPRYAGVGAVLLRRALAGAAAMGRNEIGLAVTGGNPAQRLYERLGFSITSTSLTVHVP